MGMMERKKTILLNEPHIETVTGNGVSFLADREAKIIQCQLDLSVIQSGSGTPSPSNIRPIISYKNFDVYHSSDGSQTPDIYSYSWAGGRSKGTLDLVTGMLQTEGMALLVTGNASWNAVGSKFYYAIGDGSFQKSTIFEEQISNMYPFAGVIGSGSVAVTQDKHFYLQRSTASLDYCRVWVYDSDLTLNQFKEMLNQTSFVFTYPVAPYNVQLETIPLKAFRGQNSIWNSNGGEIAVKYWTH